jgi:hypothetical protein
LRLGKWKAFASDADSRADSRHRRRSKFGRAIAELGQTALKTLEYVAPCGELVFAETVCHSGADGLYCCAGRTDFALFSGILPDSSRPAKKNCRGAAGRTDIGFNRIRMSRVEQSANRPSHPQPSLLPSFHKKTLAGFSDYPASSIAAAPFRAHPRLRESRARGWELAAGVVSFCLFYTRNIGVLPL